MVYCVFVIEHVLINLFVYYLQIVLYMKHFLIKLLGCVIFLGYPTDSEMTIKSIAASSIGTQSKRKNLPRVTLSKIIPVHAKDRFSLREKEAMIKIKCQIPVTERDSD